MDLQLLCLILGLLSSCLVAVSNLDRHFLLHVIIFYFAMFGYLLEACFLMRDLKGVDLEGRGSKEDLG